MPLIETYAAQGKIYGRLTVPTGDWAGQKLGMVFNVCHNAVCECTDVTIAPPAPVFYSGAMLRLIRIERGLTVDALSRITCIRKGAIELIERDDFTRLPAPAYVRGLIIQISKALELPEEGVVRDYMSRVPVEKWQ